MVKLSSILIILFIVSCNPTPNVEIEVEIEIQDTINYFHIDTTNIDMNVIVKGNTKRDIYIAYKEFIKQYELNNTEAQYDLIKHTYKQIKYGN